MAEIAAEKPNGFNVVSTFSGCGGSCLGFEMAGYKVLWANEFVSEAAATYRANHPRVFLSVADVRKIKPEEILSRILLRRGELDVLEGSPPCASFSTSGSREAGWGKVKKYSDTRQRVDDLFFEFARLLDSLRPKVFVAENVAGLVRGAAKGYFLEIHAALAKAGYKVESQVVDASWLGVPQARRRLIFVGVRRDLNLRPAFPKPRSPRRTTKEALAGCPKNDELEAEERGGSLERYAIGKEWDRLSNGRMGRYLNLIKPRLDAPCPTITQTAGQSGAASVVHPTEKRKLSVPEVRRLCSFPEDFALTGTYSQRVERLGRAVPPLMMKAIAETIAEEILRKCRK